MLKRAADYIQRKYIFLLYVITGESWMRIVDRS